MFEPTSSEWNPNDELVRNLDTNQESHWLYIYISSCLQDSEHRFFFKEVKRKTVKMYVPIYFKTTQRVTGSASVSSVLFANMPIGTVWQAFCMPWNNNNTCLKDVFTLSKPSDLSSNKSKGISISFVCFGSLGFNRKHFNVGKVFASPHNLFAIKARM